MPTITPPLFILPRRGYCGEERNENLPSEPKSKRGIKCLFNRIRLVLQLGSRHTKDSQESEGKRRRTNSRCANAFDRPKIKFLFHYMQYGKIVGEVPISGSKNACLPIIAAPLLTRERCILHPVPNLTDRLHMLEIGHHLGSKVQRLDKNSWSITAQDVDFHASKESERHLRTSVCLMGALLGRRKQAFVPLPPSAPIRSHGCNPNN
jgi:hypothetical protein